MRAHYALATKRIARFHLCNILGFVLQELVLMETRLRRLYF